MNLSTALLGALIIAGLGFAIRHIWRNVKSGKADCCGCSGCAGHTEGSAGGSCGCCK